MKRILVGTLVVVFAGLVGTLLGPWGMGIPGKIGANVAGAVFQKRAGLVLGCINKRLPYSEAVGFVRTGPGSVLVVMTVAVDPKIYLQNDVDASFVDVTKQLAVTLGCADKFGGGEWWAVSIQAVSIGTVHGYSKAGDYDSLVSLTLRWALGMKRDVAQAFVASADGPAYVREAIGDKGMSFINLAFYRQPANPSTVQGKLVIVAAEKFVAYVNELTKLSK